MKFLVKDKSTQIPEGKKEIEINEVEVGLGLGLGAYLLSMSEGGAVGVVATKVIGTLTFVGGLPFTTIAGGLILTTVTAICISNLLEGGEEEAQP